MRKPILLCLIGLFFIISCVPDMGLLEEGNRDASRKVLIAGQSSEFKEDVVNKVIKTLGKEEYYFKVIGLSELEKEKTKEYGAILLVTMIMARQIDGRVNQFVQNDPDNPKVIVFYTIGAEDHPPPKPDIKVDAVSSASLSSRINEVAEELAALIEERF